jgi:hypothetical protein
MATAPSQFTGYARDGASFSTASSSATPVRLIGSSALPPITLENEVVAWSDSVMLEHEQDSAASPTLRLFPRLISYLNGTQWPTRSTAYGTSRPTSSKMFRQYWELVSLLTDGKPESRIKVYDAPDSYSEIQAQLQEFLKIFAATPEFGESLQSIIGWGLLAKGVGKIQWDQRLRGGMGDVALREISPIDFFKLGGDGSLENAELVTETEIVTLAALRRTYGDLAAGIRPDAFTNASSPQTMKPGQYSSAEWAKISPFMRKILGKKGMAGGAEQHFPMVRSRKHWLLDPAENDGKESVFVGTHPKTGQKLSWGYWVEPGEPLFPRGRLVVVAGGKVMNDTCNPYYHARPPYVEFTPLRGPWSPEGMSLMGQLVSPQDVINRIMAGLLETIKASLLPSIIAPKNSMSQSDMDNMSTTISGTRSFYDPNRGGPPSFKDAPQIPSLALNMLQIEMREMDQTSGAAAIDAAAQKEQVPSKDTMEMIQNSRSSLVRVMGRAFERFLNRGGQLVISDMLQFYSVGHRISILGERGLTPMDFTPLYGELRKEGMAPEEFIRKFEYTVRPGSALDFEKDTKIQMAMLLYSQGVISKQNLFRALDVNLDQDQNTRELLAEAMQKIAVSALAAKAQQGAAPPQGGGK